MGRTRFTGSKYLEEFSIEQRVTPSEPASATARNIPKYLQQPLRRQILCVDLGILHANKRRQGCDTMITPALRKVPSTGHETASATSRRRQRWALQQWHSAWRLDSQM